MLTVAPGAEPALAAPACPGNLSLNVVGHQDDDLLFMNPDIQHDIDRGRCVLTVFATAGDAGQGAGYWRERERGPGAAYAYMAGAANNWTRRTVTVSGHRLTYDSLVGRPGIAMIFLRLPDGHGGSGYRVHGNQSLQRLWSGSIDTIRAVDGSASYSRSALIRTLTAIMDRYQPDVVRTQDYLGRFGDGDHSDHHSSAYLTLAAHKNYQRPHQVHPYLGYAIAKRPVNLNAADRVRKLEAFLAYTPHDERVCRTREHCYTSVHHTRSARRYTIGSEVGGGHNVARLARISSSSQNTEAHQQAVKVIDDAVAGAPVHPTREWVTKGGKAGSWISASWSTPQTLDKVVLHDRPNPRDRVTGGTLRFSDGTSIAVGPLPDNGSAKIVTFAPKVVTGMRFTITSVAATTTSAGLAELQAYSTNVAALASVAASSENPRRDQQADRAVDGRAVDARAVDGAIGSPAGAAREWVTVGGKAGSWLRLTWRTPQTIDRVVLYDRPNATDRITGARLVFDDGSAVTVPPLPNDGAGYVSAFPRRTITSLRLLVTSVSPATRNIGLAEIQVEPAR